jgi:ABC-type oligopeptide transport system substrate-binding subunit
MHEAEDLFMSEYPIAPIYYYVNPYLQATKVRDVLRNGLGWCDFTYAWIADE